MAISMNAEILKIMMSPLLWLVIIFVMLIFSVGALWVRKQRKLEYSCYVIRKTGNGKIDLRTMKAGWFKSKKILGGLFDFKGEEHLETGGFQKPCLRVLGGSTEDFHSIDGKKALICRMKDDDPKILVPLNKIEIQNDIILGQIAGSDLRDASVDIIKQAEKETRNRTQEIVQWIIMGGVIILALITIIMTYQFVQRAQTESWERTMEAIKIREGMGAIPSSSAP